MKIESHLSDDVVLQLIGSRLARLRLTKNLTQKQLAKEAGLGVRTVQRLESGEAATTLSSFIRICRVFGLMERFDVLIPDPAPSPIAQLKLQGKTRKRASGGSPPPTGPKKWTWGESS
jgi:transcriptional regulator with XRE-family HTH domain